MDWDPVLVPIVLIVLYFLGYNFYSNSRRLIRRLVRPEAKGNSFCLEPFCP